MDVAQHACRFAGQYLSTRLLFFKPVQWYCTSLFLFIFCLFLSTVSLSKSFTCEAIVRGWLADESLVAHLIDGCPYLGWQEVHFFARVLMWRLANAQMNTGALSLLFPTIFHLKPQLFLKGDSCLLVLLISSRLKDLLWSVLQGAHCDVMRETLMGGYARILYLYCTCVRFITKSFLKLTKYTVFEVDKECCVYGS